MILCSKRFYRSLRLGDGGLIRVRIEYTGEIYTCQSMPDWQDRTEPDWCYAFGSSEVSEADAIKDFRARVTAQGKARDVVA